MTDPGLGKTTTLAFARKPLFLMCGDDGYQTLLNANLVPNCFADRVDNFEYLLHWCYDLARSNEQGIQELVIDDIGGAEWLCCSLYIPSGT